MIIVTKFLSRRTLVRNVFGLLFFVKYKETLYTVYVLDNRYNGKYRDLIYLTIMHSLCSNKLRLC